MAFDSDEDWGLVMAGGWNAPAFGKGWPHQLDSAERAAGPYINSHSFLPRLPGRDGIPGKAR